MEGARLTGGAAPTFLPATSGRAGSRLAYEPVAGSVRVAGSGPGEHLVPGRRRRRTRQPGPWSLAGVVALRAPAWPAPRRTRELSQPTRR
jgi:hypothetical protein